MSEQNDLFNDGNALTTQGNPYFKPEVVGKDRVRGYLIRKSFKKDDLKSKSAGQEVWQRVYTLLIKEGEEYKATKGGSKDKPSEDVMLKGGELIDVYGRMTSRDPIEGKKCKIILGLEEIPLGVMVGVLYSEEKDTGQPQKAKILKPFAWFDDVNKEAVNGAAWEGASEAEPFAG